MVRGQEVVRKLLTIDHSIAAWEHILEWSPTYWGYVRANPRAPMAASVECIQNSADYGPGGVPRPDVHLPGVGIAGAYDLTEAKTAAVEDSGELIIAEILAATRDGCDIGCADRSVR